MTSSLTPPPGPPWWIRRADLVFLLAFFAVMIYGILAMAFGLPGK